MNDQKCVDLVTSSGDVTPSSYDPDLRATSVLAAGQLPRALFLGDRDDASFTWKDGCWNCLYCFEGNPFLQLGWNVSINWRVESSQRTKLAYIFLPMRKIIPLVDVLWSRGILRRRLPEPVGTALLWMHGALVAGAACFTGQTSVFRYHPWLPNRPAALATFPPISRELLA